MRGKDKRYLRSLANKLDAKFQIGKLGINDEFLDSLYVYLEKCEIAKLNILDNCPISKDEVVEILEDNDITVAGTIGHKVIVYKESKENKSIFFPR